MNRKLSRRDAIGVLGGASLGVVSMLRGEAGKSPQASSAAKIVFRDRAIIRTLLKDLNPESLRGPVLFHEHLSMHYPPATPPQPHFTDDVDMMAEEVRAAGKEGVSCIVDGGHPDMDRKLDALKRIAAQSGVHVVASGGYYQQRTYPPDISTKTPDQIADDLVQEAISQRLGAFGEIGQSTEMTDDERKVFVAVAKAHMRTGLPIFTHNAYAGTRAANPPAPRDAALRQMDILESGGVKPQSMAIGHVCCLNDPAAEVAKALAKRGAFVGFDRVTIPIVPDTLRVTMILALLEAGYAGNLLFSSDFAVARSLKKNGGAGLAQTLTVFVPMLRKEGVKEEVIRAILVDNPRRFLAFVPPVKAV